MCLHQSDDRCGNQWQAARRKALRKESDSYYGNFNPVTMAFFTCQLPAV